MTIFRTCLLATVLSSAVSAQADSLKPAAWVPLPAVGSSPETGFQYGAYVMRIFPQTTVGIPQNRLELLLQGTTQGQYQAYVWPNLYVAEGNWQFKGKLGGRYWPADYFGQGNETSIEGDKYADTALESSITVNKKFNENIAVGASFFAEWHEIELISNPTDAVLLTESISGFQGGLYSGIGVNASFDSRNNLDWPTQGQYVSGSWDIFTTALASELDFNVFHFNASQYVAVAEDVIGVSLSFDKASENTPFTHLPRPNGGATLRGANGNRWIDQSALGFQTDYRKILTPKWAFVGFADTYQVAPNISQFHLSDFHTSLGGGVRFGMTPDRFNIRLDLGWVDFESIGFTITVGEAF